MAGQDGNTLVQIGSEPNALADRRKITEGLAVKGQNYDGSLDHDRGVWVEMFGRFMPVGFYYKAFYRPKGAWKYWEPLIRSKAGLGKVDRHAHHGYFDKEYLFADVAVVGGGPAGMAAALEAAKAGGEVILIEEPPPRRLARLRDSMPPAFAAELRANRAGSRRIPAACYEIRQRLLRRQLVAVIAATVYKMRAGDGGAGSPGSRRCNNDPPWMMARRRSAHPLWRAAGQDAHCQCHGYAWRSIWLMPAFVQAVVDSGSAGRFQFAAVPAGIPASRPGEVTPTRAGRRHISASRSRESRRGRRRGRRHLNAISSHVRLHPRGSSIISARSSYDPDAMSGPKLPAHVRAGSVNGKRSRGGDCGSCRTPAGGAKVPRPTVEPAALARGAPPASPIPVFPSKSG
jgi:hypothetical protein